MFCRLPIIRLMDCRKEKWKTFWFDHHHRKSLANSSVVPALLVVEILRQMFLIVSLLMTIPLFPSFLKFNAVFSFFSAICKIKNGRKKSVNNIYNFEQRFVIRNASEPLRQASSSDGCVDRPFCSVFSLNLGYWLTCISTIQIIVYYFNCQWPFDKVTTET